MSDDLPRVAIGKIGRPHGVRGEARLFLFNPTSETVHPGLNAFLCPDRGSEVAVEVEKARYAAKFVIVKFKGIDGRQAIDEFKHAILEVDPDDLPELDDDQFYQVELLGAPVYVADEEDGDLPESGEAIGEVERFFDTGGANDVMVVRREDGSELLVPVVEHAISLLDVEDYLVILQPLEIWTPA